MRPICLHTEDPVLKTAQESHLLLQHKTVPTSGLFHPPLNLDNSRARRTNMLLLAAVVATATWSYGFAQKIPVQSPLSITKSEKSARMSCEIQTLGSSSDSTVIHWYQQKEGKAPERLLFFSGGKASVESGFQVNRYMVEKVSGQNRYVLTIKDVIPDDTATYYCAYWDLSPPPDVKIFGSGTKLIVSNKQQSGPANFEILQKEHKNQIMYVCLIEKFYPDVIRVTWTDEAGKIVENGIVKGDAWKPTKEDNYSISSWLTVKKDAETKNKNYYCNYEHESGNDRVPKQDSSKTVSQEEDCSTYPGNSTVVFSRDPLYHRTAYLVYIVLLLKSSMYYLIVLFFIYRAWATTKHRGKKA